MTYIMNLNYSFPKFRTIVPIQGKHNSTEEK